MRTNEERIAALHARAGEIRIENRQRQVKVLQFAGTAVCLCIVIAMALWMPTVGNMALPVGTGAMSASIFSNSSHVGYVVIGLVAFLLGVLLTIFCFRLQKWQKQNRQDDHV